MTEEMGLAEWSVRLGPGEQPVVYETGTESDIATVHGDEQEALLRAILIAKAPTLLKAVRGAALVFSGMLQYGNERERATGADMLPIMQNALYLLDNNSEVSGGTE